MHSIEDAISQDVEKKFKKNVKKDPREQRNEDVENGLDIELANIKRDLALNKEQYGNSFLNMFFIIFITAQWMNIVLMTGIVAIPEEYNWYTFVVVNDNHYRLSLTNITISSIYLLTIFLMFYFIIASYIYHRKGKAFNKRLGMVTHYAKILIVKQESAEVKNSREPFKLKSSDFNMETAIVSKDTNSYKLLLNDFKTHICKGYIHGFQGSWVPIHYMIYIAFLLHYPFYYIGGINSIPFTVLISMLIGCAIQQLNDDKYIIHREWIDYINYSIKLLFKKG